MKHESYPFLREKELTIAILRKNQAAFRSILNELLGCIFYQQGLTLSAARVRTFELLTVISRSAINGGQEAKSLLLLAEKSFYSIAEAETIDALCFCLVQITSTLTDMLFRPEPNLTDGLTEAEQYIRENCVQKISLAMAASRAYLSPSYFCKAFRDRYGMGFSEYLNRTRTTRAKQLLEISNMSLSAVAAAVGFEDPSYFCKVFKRLEGQTPGEYRASLSVHLPTQQPTSPQ